MRAYYWLCVCGLAVGAIASPAAAQLPGQQRGRAEMRRDQRDDKREGRRHERGELGPDRKDKQADGGEPRAEGSSATRPEHRRRHHDRLDDVVGGPDERRAKIKEKLEKMRESRKARAAEERARLTEKWGPVKDNPPLRNELRRHAWRMAKLNRLRLLAKAEGKDTLVARIEKLVAKEEQHHEARMEKLRPAAPAPSTTAPAPRATQGGAP